MILIPNIPKLCFLNLTGGCQGTGASKDHSTCDQCPAGFYGAEGFCSQCANGTQPRNVMEAAGEQMDGQILRWMDTLEATVLMTVGMFMVIPIQIVKNRSISEVECLAVPRKSLWSFLGFENWDCQRKDL